MKKILLACAIFFLLFSCKKDSTGTTYKVKYTVTGNNVSQFKITQGVTDNYVLTPFSGTKDTTLSMQPGATLKLDTKATNNNLVGSIYVNDVLKATGADLDTDGDGKTEVKIDYTLQK
ncbi:hypothetical protein QWZ08_16440 [Ferruginibacter paludis]|uniref:hypothetical protein n=1 Tax=Ferruginibacter paludis TaxID=1310417 RepID=UPI0025B4519D|nr:hypothetical protein [Ferruginibacter paludis]MDN3657240.1 hypothetical protein [Ferruginibacter paludis]